jgi:dTDP-4-dehydrorhamnose reductase
MLILITGANGMVARAAASFCRSIGDEVFALTREELDISNETQVLDVVDSVKPGAILNCAAYTDVDGSETNVSRCFDVNSAGPANLARAARRVDAGFVTISTDYVFEGRKEGFFTQRDTPVPGGAYARAKYEGEIRARNSYGRSIIVRSGWIFGHGGTNFLSVISDLLGQGKSIKAINDSFGTPTFADDLARRLRELAELDLPCIFHVTNAGDGTSYAGFAETVCDLMGYDRNLIEPAASTSLNRPAPRPANSRLACLFSERFGLAPLPHWETALGSFLKVQK